MRRPVAAAATPAGNELVVAKVEKKQRKRNPHRRSSRPLCSRRRRVPLHRPASARRPATLRGHRRRWYGGSITYMRTDSLNPAGEAVDELRQFIAGATVPTVPKQARSFRTTSKNAQEAHEASAGRPVSVYRPRSGPSVRRAVRSDLIWKRTVACQMIHGDTVAADLTAGTAEHSATGSTVTEAGFMSVIRRHRRGCRSGGQGLAAAGNRAARAPRGHPQRAAFHGTTATLHRASPVKTLEEYGIGRPSTYAPSSRPRPARVCRTREEAPARYHASSTRS